MTAETSRHAGHADIVRELIDGKVGMRETDIGVDGGDAVWQQHWNRVEASAVEAQAKSRT